MRVLYMSTYGAFDATKASIPWHLAVNGSAEVGQSTTLVLVGDATELLRAETRDALEGVGVPALRDLVEKAREKDVPIHV
jgi:predicted peroxiredoxin